MNKTQPNAKFINLNPSQAQFLAEEMALLLDAEDYPIESKMRAAEVLKKLQGRTKNANSD